MVPTVRARFGLPDRIWPTRIGLGAFGADAKFRTLTDPAKPGLIGLELDQTYPGAEMKPTRALHTYWLDPTKDDVPAEWTSITYEGLTAKEQLRFETKRSEFSKTDGGKWYPAEWTTVTVMHMPAETRYYQKSRLLLWPAEKLAPEWFRKPEGKMELQK